MRLSLTPSEKAIREEVREFLAANQPPADAVPEELDARIEFLRGWQHELHAAGLVGLSWPQEYGGRGTSPFEQIVVNRELARAAAPEVIGIVGVEVVGPSIIEFGTDAQKSAYVDRILAADDIWCQGFSEPDAGSDLAALSTRAEDKGDHFVLNGQKTWTSWAQYASWCAVLARTDREAPPHRGISYLIVDMKTPGVEVRPMIQLTGDAEFSEVFFDDVVVPRENLLGELNAGWRIAMHTLAHERGPFGLGRQVKLRGLLDQLVEEASRARRGTGRAIDSPAVRRSLARAHVEVEVLRQQVSRSVGSSIARGEPGFETSVDKVFLARAEQGVGSAALDVLGARVPLARDEGLGTSNALWHHTYLYGRAASVYGGTAQIQKNIISERILGLPRSR